jgi:Uma2 family endonuclease
MNLRAAAPLRQPPVRPNSRPEEQHFFLSDVSWESYLAIGSALADRPGLRITYDRGKLEFMTTSPRREFYKKLLDRFIATMAEELERPIAPLGNMTFECADLRALEGDECYWIEHEPRMRGKISWDAQIDPPPDLALEIEVSRSVVDRLAIYAALRVAEVWTFDGATIKVRCLEPDGTYRECEKSRYFPEVPLDEIAGFLGPDPSKDFLTVVREFRAWLRQILGK